MQCREFEERVQFLLDERQAPHQDALLQSHAQSCAGCRQLLFDQETLFRGIGSFQFPSLPRNFASRVVSAQIADADATTVRPSKQRPWLLAMGVVSTAAAALIALSIAINRWPDDRAAPGKVGMENQQAKSVASPGDSQLANEKTRAANRERPESPGLDLPDNQPQTASSLAAADVDSLERYGQALQDLAAQVPQAVDRLDEVEEATPGLRPVRTSFTLAIGTIRRTIPPQRKQAPPRPGKRDSGLLWPGAIGIA